MGILIQNIKPELQFDVNPAFRKNLGHILEPVDERTAIIQSYVKKEGYLHYVKELNENKQSPEIEELKNKHKVYFLFQNPNVRNVVMKNQNAKTLIVETLKPLNKKQQQNLSMELTDAFNETGNTEKIKEILKKYNARNIQEEPESSINTDQPGGMSVLPGYRKRNNSATSGVAPPAKALKTT